MRVRTGMDVFPRVILRFGHVPCNYEPSLSGYGPESPCLAAGRLTDTFYTYEEKVGRSASIRHTGNTCGHRLSSMFKCCMTMQTLTMLLISMNSLYQATASPMRLLRHVFLSHPALFLSLCGCMLATSIPMTCCVHQVRRTPSVM
jgi:hypothetical protein